MPMNTQAQPKLLTEAFKPTGIAIIGASLSPEKRGFQLVKALAAAKDQGRYLGEIFPINPNVRSILNIDCYASLDLLPVAPELAIICTPAHTVPKMIEQCGQRGVTLAVVLAAGFSEVSESGAALEEAMLLQAKKYGVRILGPNISGMFLDQGDINLVGFQGLRKGGISILSQSGNVALELVRQADRESQFGFNQYFGIGNQLDVGFSDLLTALSQQTTTTSAVAYIEGLTNAPEFLRSVRTFTEHKPLVVFKAGRSEVSQQAAKSHTGALAGNYRVSQDLLSSAGATLVDRTEDLLPVAYTLAHQSIAQRGRVLILTDGGGHGTIAADLVDEANITLAEITEALRTTLTAKFPGLSVGNPLDLAGIADQQPEMFGELLEVLLKDEGIDGVLWVGLFGGYHQRFDQSLLQSELKAVEKVIELQQKLNKPIILQSVYGSNESPVLRQWGNSNLCLFSSIHQAVRAVKALIDRARYLSKYSRGSTSLSLPEDARVSREAEFGSLLDGRLLTESEGRALLLQHGLDIDQHVQFDSISALEDRRDLFEGSQRYAMKVLSNDISHKSDAGGVQLNVSGLPAAKEAFQQIMHNCQTAHPDAALEGVLVGPMSPIGFEYVIGYQQDPQFGSILMFGLGGIFVELFQDIHFKKLPISEFDAQDLFLSLKHSEVLKGFRHFPALHQQKMKQLLLDVSDFIAAHPEIKSMDLNPVIAHQSGVSVVDVRIEVFN